MSSQPPIDEDLDRPPTDEELLRLSATTVQYYLRELNPANGLIRDKTDPRAPCSIAAVGLALTSVPVLIDREVIPGGLLWRLARVE